MTPGLNAIMGPTGCGKSSFLDVLAGRKDPQFVSGCILLDGRRRPANVHRYLCGYVVQDNIAVNTLTVRENLAFSAALRSSLKLTAEERNARISEIIDELGLSPVADHLLGTEYTRGLSGGERKRTCIGIELVKNPLVLYLDEPTTGLDAYTAGSVMATLRRLADKGRTIVFSIHQPKYSIYRLFDRITLICGGQIVYHGSAGQAPLDYFGRLGYFIEGYNNPADFLMDVLHGEIRPQTEEVRTADTEEEVDVSTYETLNRSGLVRRFVDEWKKSEVFRISEAYMSDICQACLAHSSRHSSGQTTLSCDPERARSTPKFASDETRLCRKSATASAISIRRINSFASGFGEIASFDSGSSHEPLRPRTYSDELLPDLPIKLSASTHNHGLTMNRMDRPEPHSFRMPRNQRDNHNRCGKIPRGTIRPINYSCAPSCSCSCPHTTYPAAYFTQLYFLAHRQCLGTIRDVKTLISHFAVQFVISFFLGVIYYDLDHSTESGVQNRAGLFFFTCLQLLFINSSMIDSFLSDRVIFRHEISSGAYRISAYLFAKIISEVLPTKAIPALLFLPITYSMAGLRYTIRAFLFWELTLSLLTITASGAAFSVSTMVTDFRVAATLLSMFFVLMMITSGFLINVISLGSWLSWLRYLSIMRFAISALLINELVDTQFCSTSSDAANVSHVMQSIPNSNRAVKTITAPSFGRTDVSLNHSYTYCISGEWYLETQAIEYTSKWSVWQNELGILTIFVLTVVNSYIYLRLMKKYK